jgi:subtilase family serine protease
MKAARVWALTGSIGLAVSFTAVTASQAVARPTPTRVALRGSLTRASERAHPAGKVAGTTTMRFDLNLKLRNAAGAQKFVKQVSTPGSKLFHHYLTQKQWLAKYGPTSASLAAAESWLRGQGFKVVSVPKNRIYVAASGSAAKIAKAFGTTLGYFTVNGHKVILAKSGLSLPGSIAGTVTGVVGVNQVVATTTLTDQGRSTTAKPNQEPGPPAGFRNPQPCTKSFNKTPDTADNSSLYAPFTGHDYDICGYKPAQLRSAYGINGAVNAGDDGSGVGVAIVDAYDSPTLFKDSARYASQNDGTHPLQPGQFFNDEPATVDNEALCNASGWRTEQSLDVQAVHAMAPGAAILYVGGTDCLNTGLLDALNTAINSGASVVTDSWGDTLGDLLDDAATKTAFDTSFMVADSTGVSVLFSSGDDGDDFAISGLATPNYPPASPFITAVGGTTLEVNAAGHRAAEFGWSTARQIMCTGVSTTSCPKSQTSPTGALAWQAGGGGGSSYTYSEPGYQFNVVPPALADRNIALFGVPTRVEPDISMDADAQSGMLIGATQAFPGGVHYGQFKEGGTSLASPLFAGVIADADQAANSSLGFLNPELYKAWTDTPSAFTDIVAPSDPKAASVIRVDFTNTVDKTDGYNVSVRAINYAGPETYCDGTGNCATRNVTLTTTPGFDSLTGLGTISSKFLATMAKF